MPPKKKTRQSGAGLGSTAKKVIKAAHDLAKQQRLLSRGLAMTPLAPIAPVARMLGYGKKKGRKKTTKKTVPGLSGTSGRKPAGRSKRALLTPVPGYAAQTGNGIFRDLGGGIGSIFGGLGSGVGSIASGLFGGGRGKAGKNTLKM